MGLVESMVGRSARGDVDCVVHRNRSLRVKAEFTGSVQFSANTAFAARAAITAAVVGAVAGAVVGVMVDWRFWSYSRPR